MSGSLILRQATRHDAVAIAALTRAAYAKWVPLIGREPLPMTVDYEVPSGHTASTCWKTTAAWPPSSRRRRRTAGC